MIIQHFATIQGCHRPDLSTDQKTCLERVLFVTFHFSFNCIFWGFLLMGQLVILVINLFHCLFFSFVIPSMDSTCSLQVSFR